MAASHAAVHQAVTELHNSENFNRYSPQHVASASLTPPDTPTADSDCPSDVDEIRLCRYDQTPATPCPKDRLIEVEPRLDRLLEFSYDLEIERDENGRLVEFGRGLWSAVYRARTKWLPHVSKLAPAASSRILAVKMPLRRDAVLVIAAEAQILSRVAATAAYEQYIVPFYGYIPASGSIVMSAIPHALSTHIEGCALVAKENFSTRTMLEPVLTIPYWRDLATQLIKGLNWLHAEAALVHGDIKPHNILLRPRQSQNGSKNPTDDFQYDALFADFSSAHDITSSSDESSHHLGGGAALSAVTPPFAAPELMTVAAMKSSRLATPASDVFSLAVTLLAAATGDLLLYPGTSSMQRLAMSREGFRVLDFVRSGPHGIRIPRKGLVEKTVAPAVVKDPSERVRPGEWLDILNSS